MSDRLPQPEGGSLFAAIDLGSNSFHMIVARLEHGSLHIIDRIKEMVRLAEGVDEQGNLDSAVEQRAMECLSRFGQRIEQISQTRTVAVGTNALRRLKYDWQFLNEAETRLGVPIEIIPGQEEARLIYRGVAQAISAQGKQRLVIDIGGGSTEFIIGRDTRTKMLDSLYFGCVSMTSNWFGDGAITARRWRKARTAVALELQGIAKSYRKHSWQEVLGSSGTMKAVRDVVLANGWSERGITVESMQHLERYLLDVGHCDQIQLEGLSERRRPVFVGGAAAVSACMEVLGIERIIVTDYALREGLLYQMLGRSRDDDPRPGAIAGLVERYRIDPDQATRVAQTCSALIAQIADQWDLPKASANWLLWSGQLHEIGLSISHHGYQRHGAYLIEHSDLPGFSRLEQQILATLVLNHRRQLTLSSFDTLIRRLQQPVRQLTVLLRIAVLLNRSHSILPSENFSLRAKGDQLTLEFADNWLAEHTLTQADLQAEQGLLQRLDLSLSIS